MDGEPAIFIFILLLLHPAVGVVVLHAIEFQNTSRETNGGITGPQEKEGRLPRAGKNAKAWTLSASKSFSYLLLCLR
jgi:hypothetical protein